MKIIPPEALLEAYSQGVFPMADSREEENVEWYSARKRGIIPIGKFHASKNLRRIIRQKRFEIKINHQFRKVVGECANRDTTWINDLIIDSYEILSETGNAYSVECYKDGKLAGGLYGVKLGAAFFGESMFKKVKEADKVAMYYCHQILQENGFLLWDTQFYHKHLAPFGCIEIGAKEYDKMLQTALENEAAFSLV
ncbi:MAG: leucyl/phenylalanyl-tRNA--protein transferase [Balneolaceae bacterium]